MSKVKEATCRAHKFFGTIRRLENYESNGFCNQLPVVLLLFGTLTSHTLARICIFFSRKIPVNHADMKYIREHEGQKRRRPKDETKTRRLSNTIGSASMQHTIGVDTGMHCRQIDLFGDTYIHMHIYYIYI